MCIRDSTNIILDPILIFGLLGAPKMGVTGAAVATVIGQCVAALVAGFCNHRYNHDVKLKFHGFRLDFHIIGTIYAVGIPTIIMQSIGSVMTYCMNRIPVSYTHLDVYKRQCLKVLTSIIIPSDTFTSSISFISTLASCKISFGSRIP